jgi:hypothetical protein
VLSHPTEPLERLSKQTPFWALSYVANTIAIRVEQRFAVPANGRGQRLQVALNSATTAWVSPLHHGCYAAFLFRHLVG